MNHFVFSLVVVIAFNVASLVLLFNIDGAGQFACISVMALTFVTLVLIFLNRDVDEDSAKVRKKKRRIARKVSKRMCKFRNMLDSCGENRYSSSFVSNMVLYVANRLKGELCTADLISMVLWFADLSSIEKNAHPVSGHVYEAGERCPIPMVLYDVLLDERDQNDEKLFSISGDVKTGIIKTNVKEDPRFFNEDDILELDSAIRFCTQTENAVLYRKARGLAWSRTRSGERIRFEDILDQLEANPELRERTRISCSYMFEE